MNNSNHPVLHDTDLRRKRLREALASALGVNILPLALSPQLVARAGIQSLSMIRRNIRSKNPASIPFKKNGAQGTAAALYVITEDLLDWMVRDEEVSK